MTSEEGRWAKVKEAAAWQPPLNDWIYIRERVMIDGRDFYLCDCELSCPPVHPTASVMAPGFIVPVDDVVIGDRDYDC
jgi:hypothetical protein